MSRQYWVSSLPPMNTADGASYNTSTTLTDVSPAPGIVLPANLLEVGSRLRIAGYGRFSTTGTPTLVLGVYITNGAIGGATFATSALTTISGAATSSVWLDGLFTVRSSGTAGTVHGLVKVAGVTATTAVALGPATAPTTGVVDTTIAQKVMVGATWGTSSASNIVIWHQLEVEVLS